MRRLRLLASSLAALPIVALATSAPRLAAQDPTPPVAKTIARIDTLHGDIRTDNYFWLREKTNPEVISYLNQENAYTDARMKHTVALQQKLYDEMLGRIKETDLSVPFRDNGYWYYNRTEKGKSYPIRVRKKGSLDAPEEVILDENALAAGKKFSSLGDFAVSPGGSRVAYLHDTTALRVFTLYVKNLGTAKLLGDSISNVVPSIAWANDTILFYQTADSARRSNAVWRHVLGTPKSSDVKVFQEDDPPDLESLRPIPDLPPPQLEVQRAYAMRAVKTRLHQRRFRELVVGAYNCSCSVCTLRHWELLDAAHIVPDREERGLAEIPNGLALCRIHHAAFDANILGVDPERKVHIRTDVLAEIDGPMLKHGLQEMHGRLIVVPRDKRMQPKRAYLEERFERFKVA